MTCLHNQLSSKPWKQIKTHTQKSASIVPNHSFAVSIWRLVPVVGLSTKKFQAAPLFCPLLNFDLNSFIEAIFCLVSKIKVPFEVKFCVASSQLIQNFNYNTFRFKIWYPTTFDFSKS